MLNWYEYKNGNIHIFININEIELYIFEYIHSSFVYPIDVCYVPWTCVYQFDWCINDSNVYKYIYKIKIYWEPINNIEMNEHNKNKCN